MRNRFEKLTEPESDKTAAQTSSSLPILTRSTVLMLSIAVGVSAFMEMLDMTIANVSVPTIAGSFGASPTQGTWIISAYSVAAAIAVPLTGWFSKQIGEARLLVSSVLLFTLFSAIAAFSVNLQMLVVIRLLQGFVSGPMLPLAQTLLLRVFPVEKRGIALSFWAVTLLVAPLCGPILGGYISSNFSWRWIFLINVPVGLLSASTIWAIMGSLDTAKTKLPLDRVGLILMVVGIGALELMLETGNEYDWFASAYITSLAILAFVSLSFFIAWVLTSSHPIVDLHLFRDNNFRYGVLIICLGYMTFFASVVVVPLWLQTVMGYTPLNAGLAIGSTGIFMLILGPLVARNIGRLNLRLVATFSFSVLAIVAFWNSFLSLDATFWTIVKPRIIQGIGMSCFFIPVQALMLANIQQERLAAASGLYSFLRTLGAAMGTAIGVAVWENLQAQQHSRLVENVTSYSTNTNTYIEALHGARLSTTQSFAVLDQLITKQSYMLATNEFFQYSALSFLCLMSIVWLLKSNRKA